MIRIIAILKLPNLVSFGRLVNAKILMIPSKYLRRVATGVVKEDEVFQQIQKVFLFTDSAQHRFQRHTARFLFG